MEQGKLYIGVDLGGTKIEAALVDQSGRIQGQLRQSTDVPGGPDAVAKQISNLIRALEEKTKASIGGVGIGIPGQLDLKKENVIFAPNLFWKNVLFKQNLAKYTALPIRMDNDVRVATLGEWLFGAGRGIQNFVCLFLGTGIGGGIVINGELYTGSTNSAGEVGHMTILMHGPVCSCGNRGCLEAMASGWAIAKQAQLAIQENKKEGHILWKLASENVENITTELVSKAYSEGDLLCKKLIQNVSDALVAGGMSLVNAFNPERLILGGGLLNGFPQFLKTMDEGIKKHALSSATSSLKVMVGECKDAPILGAISLFRSVVA